MQDSPKHILLAENNCVARSAICFLLKQLGHYVALADHVAALRTLIEHSSFAAILIDVKMIESQPADSLCWLPEKAYIVGLRSELDYPEAGNEFHANLMKPVSRQQLARALAEIRRRVNSLPPLIAKEELLARVGGNRELLRQMVDLFRTQADQWRAQMRAAVEQRNSEELYRIAHQAKGSLANFSAPQAVFAAHKIQEIAHVGQWVQIAEAVGKLEALILRVSRELAVE